MILLDTNVLSALMRAEPDVAVYKWLDRQPFESIWITSVTVMELRFGLRIMQGGRKKEALTKALQVLLKEKVEGRIAAFDFAAAERAAELMATRKSQGRPGEIRDVLIAGIALANRATLATRNVAHFDDLSVSVVNPWNT